MKRSKAGIPSFNLGPHARAGIFIKKMQDPLNQDPASMSVDHDVYSPHRDNHYLIFILRKGKGKMRIDFKDVRFSAPALTTICPGQVHHALEYHQMEGWVLSFDPSLMPGHLAALFTHCSRTENVIRPGTLLLAQLSGLADTLCQLKQEEQQPYTGQAMYAALQTILHLLANVLEQKKTAGKTSDSRSAWIEQQFFQLLEKHYKTWKKPADYAAALSITVSHLNDTIKDNTGFSVSHHIQETVLLEAKRQLYHTSFTVKEIAYALGYDDQGYFIRLFKKVTGSTPIAFRQQFRE